MPAAAPTEHFPLVYSIAVARVAAAVPPANVAAGSAARIAAGTAAEAVRAAGMAAFRWQQYEQSCVFNNCLILKVSLEFLS